MNERSPIPTPVVEHPTLCWKTPPLTSVRPSPMVHCNLPKGHHELLHSWEAARTDGGRE